MALKRDEREREIDLQAVQAAYVVVSFGLLILVAYRSVAHKEAAWDLLGLAVLGGAVNVSYTTFKRAISRQLLVFGLWIGVLAALTAVLVVLVTHVG